VDVDDCKNDGLVSGRMFRFTEDTIITVVQLQRGIFQVRGIIDYEKLNIKY
jgi:hypothetical protein